MKKLVVGSPSAKLVFWAQLVLAEYLVAFTNLIIAASDLGSGTFAAFFDSVLLIASIIDVGAPSLTLLQANFSGGDRLQAVSILQSVTL